MAERTPSEPDEPTRDLGRALSIAASVGALPLHLREPALRTACGEDTRLYRDVLSVLRSPVRVESGEQSPAPGLPRTFGRYELLVRIGEGSMGVVFRAMQSDTGRLVALKLLRPGAASDAVLQRFRREVVLLARLQHPCIAQVLDAGHVLTQVGHEPYLAMELVEGPGLLTGVEQFGLNHRQRVELLVQMCRAIAHAHRRGVIHRDLKPENVLLQGETGALQPRILDFGVATATTANSTEATLSKHVVGTLGYIAPEQINGEVDVRCDVYSLGAIAYEVLTGHQPIAVRGLGVLTAIARIRDTEPPPPSRHDPRLCADLDAVLGKALARDPEERYASADHLGDDLARWLQGRPVEARRPTPLYLLSRFVRRQPGYSTLTALLLLAIAFAATLASTGFAAAHTANTEFTALLTSTVGHLRDQVNGAGRPRRLPDDLRASIALLVQRHPDDVAALRVEADFLQLDSDLARAHGRDQQALALREKNLRLRQDIANRGADADCVRDLAIAHVLVGDMHKEMGRNSVEGNELAEPDYVTAHAVFQRLHAEAPGERRTRDDLAHSHLRLAHLALARGDVAAARHRIDEAAVLVTGLAKDFGGHPYTHRLLREYLGHSAAVATQAGSNPSSMALLERMLMHMREARRLEADSLNAAEFLLATTRSYAAACRDLGQSAKAQQLLSEAEEVAHFLADRDPHNVFALEERILMRKLQARFALDENDLPRALRLMTIAASDLLDLQEQVDGSQAQARLCDIVEVTSQALCGVERQDPASREAAVAAGRLLLQPLGVAAGKARYDRELRITLAQLQALVGNSADASAAKATLADAQREGWFDPRLWLAATQLLERSGEFTAALENLGAPPKDLSEDLRQAGDRIRARIAAR